RCREDPSRFRKSGLPHARAARADPPARTRRPWRSIRSSGRARSPTTGAVRQSFRATGSHKTRDASKLWVSHDADELAESPLREARDARAPAFGSGSETVRARIAVAVEICCARPTLRRTARIAAVVGLVLTAINEGDSLVRGDVSAATGIKIALNFVVPFI